VRFHKLTKKLLVLLFILHHSRIKGKKIIFSFKQN